MANKSLLNKAQASRRGAGPGRRYDRRAANRISLWLVLVVAIAFAAYLAVELSVDPVTVSADELRVYAVFGFRLALSDIREVTLQKSRAVGKRIFANEAFGLFREGDYNIEGLGEARVFLKRPNVSYVAIRTSEKDYAISLGSLEKDQLLYTRIKGALR